MILYQNVYITVLTYADEKGLYVLETGWTVVIFHWDSFFGPQGYLSYNEFKAKFPNVKTDFLLYGGILTAIKRYNRRLRLEVKENFVIGDASV